MKYLFKGISWNVLLISLLLFVSCETDDDSNSEENQETAEQIETSAKLIGDWKLVSSKVNGELIGEEDFAYLKESYASFNEDNTYKVFYKKTSDGSTSTSTLSGTYAVNGLNSVTFYNSTSEIELIDETLQITSTNLDNETQIDIFIRSDNAEFGEENNEEPVDVIDDQNEDNTKEPDNSYDGTDVISKMLGIWTISGAEDDCQKKNTIEFKTSDLLVFTQHKKTFNRADLIRNNINVSYPMPAKFSASVTKGYNTVTFDTEAECQLIKESKLHYTVTDAETIMMDEVSSLTIKILNDNTLTLIYNYKDDSSNEQEIQFVYKKI